MDFSKYLFRCSALGHLMSEGKGDTHMDRYNKAVSVYNDMISKEPAKYNKDGNTVSKNHINWYGRCDKQSVIVSELKDKRFDIELSDGAKTHLMDIYISEKTGRKTDIVNKYIKKGLAVEEDGITLYSRLKKAMFRKNETYLFNKFIKGTPDLFIGETIGSALRIPDIKCSWDVYTFYRTFIKDVNKLYYWQLQGYMWLTCAKHADLAYCLVNTPEPLIEAEKRNLWYKLGQPDETGDLFVNAACELESSMRYDDIPLRERLLEYSFERDDEAIAKIEKYVIEGRKYLAWLDTELNNKFSLT